MKAEKPQDPTATRKDAVIFDANTPAEMVDYYLAEDLTKTWLEDFTDGDTGEVLSIQRQDIIERRGTLITPDKAASLNFYIQAGDIKLPIKMSDQRRQGREYNNTRLKPYAVTASINRKRQKFILEAQTVELAVEVARDWIELNYNGDFTILGASALLNVVLLNTVLERINEAGDVEEVAGDGEADGETTRYYKADAEVKINYFGEEAPEDVNFTFIVKTADVDSAKAAASAWISQRMKANERRNEDREIEAIKTTLTAAAPFPCTALINRTFCEAYRVLTD